MCVKKMISLVKRDDLVDNSSYASSLSRVTWHPKYSISLSWPFLNLVVFLLEYPLKSLAFKEVVVTSFLLTFFPFFDDDQENTYNESNCLTL